jgi:hypothetical protein
VWEIWLQILVATFYRGKSSRHSLLDNVEHRSAPCPLPFSFTPALELFGALCSNRRHSRGP